MISVCLKDGREFDVDSDPVGGDYGSMGRPFVISVITEVWDAEGNSLQMDDFSEAEQAELQEAIDEYWNNSDNFCCCDED